MQKSSDAVANGYSAARRSASQATGLEEGTHWFEGLLLVVVLLCCCRKYYQRRQANAAPSWTKCEPPAIFSLCSMTMLWQCPLTSVRPSQDQDEGSVRARGQRRLDGGRRGGASDVGRPRAGAGARSQDGLLAVRQHLRPRRHITGRCTGALLQVRHLPLHSSCVGEAMRGSSDRSLLVPAVSSRLAGSPAALRAVAARRTRRRNAKRMVRTGSSRSARSRRQLLTTTRTSTSIVRTREHSPGTHLTLTRGTWLRLQSS